MEFSQHSVSTHPEFSEFVTTIACLRDPNRGCPWDREQTHASLVTHMIEETYEAVDAIESNDMDHLREELGDMLLQVVLQCQIAADEGLFTIDDVCHDINAKMIRRHPHVFGTEHAENAGAVLDLWAKVKSSERKEALDQADTQQSLLDDVPKSMPALMQAQKIAKKAVSQGFEWESLDDIWDQVYEEQEELKEAYTLAEKDHRGRVVHDTATELEFGDVLFSVVQIGRRMGLDCETALRLACTKFRRRWSYMEQAAQDAQTSLEEASMDEQQTWWDAAKKEGL